LLYPKGYVYPVVKFVKNIRCLFTLHVEAYNKLPIKQEFVH